VVIFATATGLHEGTEVDLLPLDPQGPARRRRSSLDQALEDSDEDVKAGRLVAAAVIFANFGPVEESPHSLLGYGSGPCSTRDGVVVGQLQPADVCTASGLA